MRALSLVVVLLAAAAQAQVAGLCGAGKVCKPSRVVTPVQSATTPAFDCSGGQASGSGLYCYSNVLPAISVAGVGTVVFGQAGFSQYNYGPIYGTSYVATAQGFEGGTSYAGFPSCIAGRIGRLLYDSTNNVWRYCDGATWQILATSGSSDENWAAYEPSTLATGVDFIGRFKPARTHTTARMTCRGRTAGSGTGNVTISVYDYTAAASRCTLTVACNSSGGSLATATACAITATNEHALTVNATGCSAAPFANAVCNVTFE